VLVSLPSGAVHRRRGRQGACVTVRVRSVAWRVACHVSMLLTGAQLHCCRCPTHTRAHGVCRQAIGFVRQSDAAEHQLGAVVGRTGLMRWAGVGVCQQLMHGALIASCAAGRFRLHAHRNHAAAVPPA
jgi:hypothetical protein